MHASGTAAGFLARVSPAQVVACGIVVASIGWSFWLLRDRPLSDEVELLPGTVLPYAEMAVVQAALDKAQLADHRTDDGRIWVPRSRQGTYQRALVDADALPQRFGSSLHRVIERNSPWQSSKSQQQAYRVAIQDELKQVICAMPGIEDASVLYDEEQRTGLDGGIGSSPLRTASVNVRTRPDAELEPERVQAIRVLVAAAIAGLSPDRVAVIDLRTGQHHAGPLAATPSPAGDVAGVDPELARRIAHEKHLAMKLRHALGFVKGAIVNVTIGFAVPVAEPDPAAASAGPPRRAQAEAAANAPAEVGRGRRDRVASPPAVAPPPAPQSVAVAIAIPEGHFQDEIRAALARDPRADHEACGRQAEERIRGIVRQVLPADLQADRCRIALTRIPAVAGAVGRRDIGTALVPTQRSVPTEPQTPGEFIDAAWVAIAGGRPGDVPREVWLLAIALCAALLAWLVLRAGDRPAQPRRSDKARRHAARIDWSRIDAGRPGAEEAGVVEHQTRAAA
jgi:type III secretory pathway lipoprotein EscJ